MHYKKTGYSKPIRRTHNLFYKDKCALCGKEISKGQYYVMHKYDLIHKDCVVV